MLKDYIKEVKNEIRELKKKREEEKHKEKLNLKSVLMQLLLKIVAFGRKEGKKR